MKYTRILFFCALTLLLLNGCTQEPKSNESSEDNTTYATVLESDPAGNTLTIRLKSPEESTTVHVYPGDALTYKKGMPIQGTLTGDHMDAIWPADPIQKRIMSDRNAHLRQDTVTRGLKVFRAAGEYLPPFALYSQDAQLITPEAWKGQYVVMNFIFTRCAQPTMCPASTARMVRLQREAKTKGIDNLQLVTITFDPEYDTPGILKYYALTRGIDTENFTLLTGPSTATQDLTKQFGILIRPDDGTLDHTMATLIIDTQGKIRYRKDGSRWSVQEFIDQLNRIQANP